IGITTPSQALTVNGNVLAIKIIAKPTANWPDYVFADNYELPSLESVHDYVKENKHLPDMPSATTVSKDGQDVGDIQMKLLKKMEEMTLYMIDQQKKIESLQQ